jgi:hypothetical integral membrane protein (TIGR02206 family)
MAHAAMFERFGPVHLGALACVALGCLSCVVLARRGGPVRGLRLSLAALMVGGSLLEVASGLAAGRGTLEELAPLQLCDLSLFLAAFTLATGSRRTLEPLYFFAMAGTVPALLTPELPCRVTAGRFLAYFGLHGLTVVALALLVLGLRLVPARGAWWRAFLWLNAYAAVVGAVDVAAGANFMYLRAKPAVPTLFDWLGPWPLYLVSLEAVALLLFALLQLPLRAGGPLRPPRRDLQAGCAP